MVVVVVVVVGGGGQFSLENKHITFTVRENYHIAFFRPVRCEQCPDLLHSIRNIGKCSFY